MAGVVLTPLVMRGLKTSGYLSRRSNSVERISERKTRLLKAGALCGIFMLIGTATQQIGLLTVSAGKSGFISSIYIVFTPLFSVIVGSKVKRRTVLCIALAIIGFAVMSLKGGLGGATQGDWLTLVSAAGFAAQIVAVNCFVDRDNAILISQAQFFFCGIAGLVIAIIAEGPTLAAVFAGVPVLLYQTFVPTAGGYTLQIIGQKYTDSSTAALIMSLEAVFAMIFGALFLHEIMSVREIMGAAIIFGATILGQKE
jgi:drug/metabolite transporter (DMT)-like permease